MKNIYKICLFFTIFAIFATPLTKYAETYAEEQSKLRYEDTQPSTAEPEEESDHSSFLISYFDNLTQNLGNNEIGSCAYVALTMLLGYYDTYLSDNIIPEQYDVVSVGSSANMIRRNNSPGTLSTTLPKPDDVSWEDYNNYVKNISPQDYYNYIQQNANNCLHAKLITIGDSEGYYDYTPGDDESPTGLGDGERNNVLYKYLEDEVGLIRNTDYVSTFHYLDSSTTIRNAAISSVQAGIPVMLGVKGEFEVVKTRSASSTETETRGHVVIAYDYDEENDLLYCHMGWGSGSTHDTIESHGYTVYDSCFWINWNIPHSHSNNYGVTTNGVTNYYCSCSYEIYTYHNGHRYDYSYSQNTLAQHKAFCVCGLSINQNHNMSGNSCTLCYKYHYPHDYTYDYVSIDANTHKSLCECGAHITSSHTMNNNNACTLCGYGFHTHSMVYTVVRPGMSHRANCASCGYSATELCIDSLANNGNIAYCMKCGQEVASLWSLVSEQENEIRGNSFLTALQNLRDE